MPTHNLLLFFLILLIALGWGCEQAAESYLVDS